MAESEQPANQRQTPPDQQALDRQQPAPRRLTVHPGAEARRRYWDQVAPEDQLTDIQRSFSHVETSRNRDWQRPDNVDTVARNMANIIPNSMLATTLGRAYSQVIDSTLEGQAPTNTQIGRQLFQVLGNMGAEGARARAALAAGEVEDLIHGSVGERVRAFARPFMDSVGQRLPHQEEPQVTPTPVQHHTPSSQATPGWKKPWLWIAAGAGILLTALGVKMASDNAGQSIPTHSPPQAQHGQIVPGPEGAGTATDSAAPGVTTPGVTTPGGSATRVLPDGTTGAVESGGPAIPSMSTVIPQDRLSAMRHTDTYGGMLGDWIPVRRLGELFGISPPGIHECVSQQQRHDRGQLVDNYLQTGNIDDADASRLSVTPDQVREILRLTNYDKVSSKNMLDMLAAWNNVDAEEARLRGVLTPGGAPRETAPPSTGAPRETAPPSREAPRETAPPSTGAPRETAPPSREVAPEHSTPLDETRTGRDTPLDESPPGTDSTARKVTPSSRLPSSALPRSRSTPTPSRGLPKARVSTTPSRVATPERDTTRDETPSSITGPSSLPKARVTPAPERVVTPEPVVPETSGTEESTTTRRPVTPPVVPAVRVRAKGGDTTVKQTVDVHVHLPEGVAPAPTPAEKPPATDTTPTREDTRQAPTGEVQGQGDAGQAQSSGQAESPSVNADAVNRKFDRRVAAEKEATGPIEDWHRSRYPARATRTIRGRNDRIETIEAQRTLELAGKTTSVKTGSGIDEAFYEGRNETIGRINDIVDKLVSGTASPADREFFTRQLSAIGRLESHLPDTVIDSLLDSVQQGLMGQGHENLSEKEKQLLAHAALVIIRRAEPISLQGGEPDAQGARALQILLDARDSSDQNTQKAGNAYLAWLDDDAKARLLGEDPHGVKKKVGSPASTGSTTADGSTQVQSASTLATRLGWDGIKHPGPYDNLKGEVLERTITRLVTEFQTGYQYSGDRVTRIRTRLAGKDADQRVEMLKALIEREHRLGDIPSRLVGEMGWGLMAIETAAGRHDPVFEKHGQWAEDALDSLDGTALPRTVSAHRTARQIVDGQFRAR